MSVRVAFLIALALTAWPATAGAQSPLTLAQAISEALRASPQLQAPEDGRTLAAIRERQAAARFGVKFNPQFQTGTDPIGLSSRSIGVVVSKQLLTGTLIRLQADSVRFGTGSGELRDAGYTVGISQPLLRGWKTVASADLMQARRSLQSADTARLDARQRLIVQVAETYFEVVKSKRLAAVAEQGFERARLLKVTSEARSRVGLATELDVLRADLLASQAEAALVTQRDALENARDGLSTLIGRSADDRIELSDGDAIAFATASFDSLDAAISAAVARRPDVREARERIGDARRHEKVARWNLLPPVNLDVGYTQRGLGPGESIYGPWLNGWRFGLSSNYAIDRSDETAGAAIAAVSVRAADREARDIERKAADEIRRAYRAQERTAATLTIQMKAVDLATRQVRLAQLRYEAGIAGNFDVIDAESNLMAAEAARVAAEIDRSLAALTLRRATGMLDPENFQP
jgi:outer membrane protein